MKKMYTKLIAITLTLILSASMVVMSTYAWFVLSENPVATGIEVSIGGGNTILIAPDLTQVVDGQTFHYPGAFSDKMYFSQHESYDYLQDLGGLTPVSTADGVNWLLPAYYDQSDEQVLQGQVFSGQIKDVQDFTLDNELAYANLDASETDKIEEGSYIYLDFWVVSNGGDYTLRISTGEDQGGSFLMDLPQPTQADNSTGYELGDTGHNAGAAVRVGFLANALSSGDEAMLQYQASDCFDERYTSLRGYYQEPDSGAWTQSDNRFTIYEPNCDSHPTGAASEGSYVLTQPLGVIDGVITPVCVSGQVTAQKSSLWMEAANGSGSALSQRFQAALMGMDTDGMSTEEISNTFYGSYLQKQLAPYVDKGAFIQNAADLNKFGESITAEQLGTLDTAGATSDVYIIELEKHIPQRIRMFIWLEGQDVDCVNSVSASSFALQIELAGGSE